MTMASLPADLFQRILDQNPFTDNRVNAPSDDDIDVADLNRSAFERLTTLAREALSSQRGIGAMVWGEAGVGKSHLLSRLVRWARLEGNGCPIYLHNLQASPSNLPRVLLRSVLSHLTWTDRSSFAGTALFRMLGTALRHAFAEAIGKQSWPVLRQGLFSVLVGDPAGPADAGLADATIHEVFYRFYRSVHRTNQRKEDGTTAKLAVQWLRGEPIPAAQAHELLGLPSPRNEDAVVMIEDAQRIKNVLAALTRLAAACAQPFILCFDQVDNLEPEQAGALSRFLEALIDSSKNLLVVTAGIQPTLMGWHQSAVIQASAWDRLAQVPLQLLKLTPMQARHLVEARLRHFFAPFEELPELRRQFFDDSLFPLGSHWFEDHLGATLEVRPREILNAAREAWYREQGWLQQQGGSAWLSEWASRQNGEEALLPPVQLNAEELHEIIDRAITDRMTEHVNLTRGKPIDRESMAEVVAQLLGENHRLDPSSALTKVLRPEELGYEYPSAYHFFLEHHCPDGSDVRTGVVIAVGTNGTGLYHAFSKLSEDMEPPRRILIFAGEKGLPTGSKGEALFNELQQRPNCTLEVRNITALELNTLDALNATWNLARSEDLEISLPDGRTRQVTPDEVMWSHQRNGRLNTSELLNSALAAPILPASDNEPEPEPMAEPTYFALAEPAVAAPFSVPEPMMSMSLDDNEGTLLLDSSPSLAEPVVEASPIDRTVPMSAYAEPLDEILLDDAIVLSEEIAEAEPVVEEALEAEPIEASVEAQSLDDIELSDEITEAVPVAVEEDAADLLLSDEPATALVAEAVPVIVEEEAEELLLEDEPAMALAVEEEAIEVAAEAEEVEEAVLIEEDVEELLLEEEPAELEVVVSEDDDEAILLEDAPLEEEE